MSLIEARGLAKSFGGDVVLQGVNIAIDPSEIVTIVGPNGSGKSTLLRMLAGVLKPDARRDQPCGRLDDRLCAAKT